MRRIKKVSMEKKWRNDFAIGNHARRGYQSNAGHFHRIIMFLVYYAGIDTIYIYVDDVRQPIGFSFRDVTIQIIRNIRYNSLYDQCR